MSTLTGSLPQEAAENGLSSRIRIFARIRPPHKRHAYTPNRHWVDVPATHSPGRADTDEKADLPRIGFLMPKDDTQGLINNSRETFDFRFDHVFNTDARQEEVFDCVARPVVDSVLAGYNGTVFAYGQTGTGKTFTITGGAEKYADRGLIPRAIQYLFKQLRKGSEYEFTVNVSYLELYNENGYDLLDASRDAKKLEDLPRVTIQEDTNQMTHVRNLSVVPARTEEEALNLLFIGDTNRMIAETPSNPSSSRSHCIFILSVTSQRAGDDRIRRSKMYIVDLAGSERVARTGINGKILKEAKYINLSLHYLEQVILALYEKSQGRRVHIPYRNSLMTTILRDSLGGNCKTTMIATLAVEDPFLDESICTCRFAQRVALIQNSAMLNEEVDPVLLIEHLKREIARLKTELAIARGEGAADADAPLPDYEIQRVHQAVQAYLNDRAPDAELVFADYRKMVAAFKYLKQITSGGASSGPPPPGPTAVVPDRDELTRQHEKLRRLVSHRDNEINVLVGLLNQYKRRFGDLGAALGSSASLPSLAPRPSIPPAPTTASTRPTTGGVTAQSSAAPSRAPSSASTPSVALVQTRAFEAFRQAYPKMPWIEEQKSILKQKYTLAKSLGEQASQARAEIKTLKSRLSEPADPLDADALRARDDDKVRINSAADRYKLCYEQLKELKMEIEHLQLLLDRARQQMTSDFYASQASLGSGGIDGDSGSNVMRPVGFKSTAGTVA